MQWGLSLLRSARPFQSVVTLVAVAFSGGSTAAKEIGVGAALGGPLILSTVAYASSEP